MKRYIWAVVKSYDTGEYTGKKHYIEDKNGRGIARCGMVDGTKTTSIRHSFFKRKCRKCKVSETADLKKGLV